MCVALIKFFCFVAYFILIKMATGQEKAVDQKAVEDIIAQINSDNSYRVIPKEEYEMLMKRNVPLQDFRASTPKPPGEGAIPKHSPRDVFPTPRLFSNSALYQNPNSAPIKLPMFSGSDTQKGDVSFDVWSYEVRCLKNQHPEYIVLQCVRSSLKGVAREMLIPLGESATVDEILQKLEDFYGNVFTAENIMQSFYSDHQKEGENIVTYGSRLEQLVSKAVRLGHIDFVAKDAMLRSKFWSGLRDQQLRNASRQKYETIRDFPSLMREIRQIEQEEKNLNSVSIPVQKVQSSNVTSNAVTVSNHDLQKQLTELMSCLKKLETRMSKLEQENRNASNSYNSFQSAVPQTQGDFRGSKGNYQGNSKGTGGNYQNSRDKGNYSKRGNRGYGGRESGQNANYTKN